MKTQTTVALGMSISVNCSEGEGPAVVLCHGTSSSHQVFRHQLEGPLGRRFRLFAFDFPGHGESQRAPDPASYTIPGLADVLVAVSNNLGLSGAVYMGWSLGGHVVIHAAERLPSAAGFFITGAPPLVFPPPLEKMYSANFAMDVALQAEFKEPAVRAYLSSYFKPGTEVPEFLYEAFVRTDPRMRAALGASIRPDGFRDERAIIANLHKPLAIVYGGHDQLLQRSYFDEITAPTLWRGAVQDLPHVGHTPQWEDPAAFDSLLESFVDDCTR